MDNQKRETKKSDKAGSGSLIGRKQNYKVIPTDVAVVREIIHTAR